MTAFWLIAAAMVAAAATLVLLPLWQGRRGAALSRDEANARIFQERLVELQSEHAEGRIDTAQLEQMRAELERTLLLDVPASAPGTAHADRRWLLGGGSALALALPLLALGYYYLQPQRPAAQSWMDATTTMAPLVSRALDGSGDLPAEALEDLPAFTQALKAEVLRQGLSDPDGLYLLGLSQLELGQPEAALEALARARTLAPDRPDVAYAGARSLIALNQGRLDTNSAGLLAEVLAADPRHQGALLLVGFGAFNAGAYAEAIGAWERLLALRDPESEGAATIRNGIAEARRRLTLARAAAATDDTEREPVAAGPRLAVSVDLSPELRTRLPEGATLFVFARAEEGPPMPVAVVRQPVERFPVEVVLDDSTAMVPSMALSTVPRVVVGARVSAAGTVESRPGDLRGQSAPIAVGEGTRAVSLVIDSVLEAGP